MLRLRKIQARVFVLWVLWVVAMLALTHCDAHASGVYKCATPSGTVYQGHPCTTGEETRLSLVDNGRGYDLRKSTPMSPGRPKPFAVGDTVEQVRAYIGNNPVRTTRSSSSRGTYETWHTAGATLYFKNGVLTEIRE